MNWSKRWSGPSTKALSKSSSWTADSIDGERMGHLKKKLAIDTIVPLRSNMDLYADAIGLTRLPDFVWEPYVPLTSPPSATSASPRPAAVEKREAKRQRTLAERKAAAACARCRPTRPSDCAPQTWLGLGRESAELEPVSRAVNGGGES